MRPPTGIVIGMSNMLTESALTATLQEAAADLTMTMLTTSRVPLVSAHTTAKAAAYGMWVDEPLYMNARWLVYIGSTSDMHRRLSEHRRTFSDCQGIAVENVYIGVLPSATDALARWAEAVMLDHARPAINLILPGAGCKGRGRVREAGGPTAFRMLHPRISADADPVAQGKLRQQVAAHLTRTAAPDWCIDRLNIAI